MNNKLLTLGLLATAILAGCGGSDPQTEPTDPEETKPVTVTVPTPAFARGADISWVSEMEAGGKSFRKKDGTAAGIMDVLKDVGVNSVRLRVWVDPPGGWSGKADLVKLASRAYKAGLAVMVDFHYSDFFADPGRQTIPAAWAADKEDLTKMASHVSDHTTEVLTALKEAGVTPAWVQVGNETRNGMLWPSGQLWTSSGDVPNGRANFTKLLNAGYEAAKAVFPNVLVLAHLNNAYEDNAWWFSQIKAAGGKFDAIALSHYPQAETAFTASEYNAKALTQIKALITKFNVPVIVSEIGVTTPADEAKAAEVLSAFMTEVKKIDRCAGVFYWEPEVYGGWKPAVYGNADQIYKYTGKKETWGSYGMGAFLSDGRPSAVMDALTK